MLLENRTINHLGYLVPSIERAVAHWASTVGAGPFFIVERMKFDEVLHYGKPCTLDHSAAFGQWGSVIIELQQIFASAPETLTQRLIPGASPILNHVAYVSPTPEQDSAQLSAAGYELFLYAKFGEVEVRFHDTRAILGQAIEIHRQSDFLDAFFSQVAGAARGWDGKGPLRPWK
jgi:hypothetical protein